ncbi:sterol regulatory element binding protein cleavage-activating protein, partial [Culex quinquefasciatus]
NQVVKSSVEVESNRTETKSQRLQDFIWTLVRRNVSKIGKLMVQLSQSENDEIGDGTTGVVILAGALLDQTESLLDRFVLPMGSSWRRSSRSSILPRSIKTRNRGAPKQFLSSSGHVQHRKTTASQKPGSSTARKKSYQTSLIWCLDLLDNLIVTGCADGRLKFWEFTTGNFKGIYEPEHTRINGVPNIKFTGNKVVAARLSGRIDFLRLETYTQGRSTGDLRPRTGADQFERLPKFPAHISTGSAGSLNMFQQPNSPASVHHASEEELRCILEFHQQGTGGSAGDVSGAVYAARSLRADLVSWPVRAQLDVTSAENYRKLREYEQEKFLSMVKQVKDAGVTLAIRQRGFDDEANYLQLQQH